jgi:hypothetical protein
MIAFSSLILFLIFSSPLLRASEVAKKFKGILTCAKRTGTAGTIATYKSKIRSRAQFVSTALMPHPTQLIHNLSACDS